MFRTAAGILFAVSLSVPAFAQWRVAVEQDKLTDKDVLRATVDGFADNKSLYQLTLSCKPSSSNLFTDEPFVVGELSLTTFGANQEGRPIPFNIDFATSDVARLLMTSRVDGVMETRSVRVRRDNDPAKSATVVRGEFDNRANFFGFNFSDGVPTARFVVADVFPGEVVEFRFDGLTPEQREQIQTHCDKQPVVETPESVKRGQADPLVRKPRLLREVKPQYTPQAMKKKIEGEVLLECVITADGTVGDVRILQSLDARSGLDQEAVKAARQWRFMPGTRLGQPVPVAVTIAIAFTLRK